MPAKSNHARTAKPRARAKAAQARTRAQRAAAAQLPPTTVDMRRYMDWRAGISALEISARENVRVATIEASIERMRNFAAANTAEMAELSIRAIAREVLPDAKRVIQHAMEATMVSPVKVGINEKTGAPHIEYVETPDHKIRLEAVDKVRALFSASQPKTPLVAVNNSNTVNTQNNAAGMLGAGSSATLIPGMPAQLSSEAIIRQIRAERGLALPSETAPDAPPPVLVERDMELDADLDDEDDSTAEQADLDTIDGEYQDGDDDKDMEEAVNGAQSVVG